MSLKRLNGTLKPLSDVEDSDNESKHSPTIQFKTSGAKKAKLLRKRREDSSSDSASSDDEEVSNSIN